MAVLLRDRELRSRKGVLELEVDGSRSTSKGFHRQVASGRDLRNEGPGVTSDQRPQFARCSFLGRVNPIMDEPRGVVVPERAKEVKLCRRPV